MSLLPRTHVEFQSKAYWENFFQKRKSAFEWYGEYLDLCHILHRYLKPQNRVLMVGCGNSKLSEDLYDVGCANLENIDISDTVIKQMTAKNHTKRPLMNFVVMDVMSLTYESSSFDCVLDKGTLDAIFTDDSEQSVSKVKVMFSEVTRVLKTGGRYICVSLAQEHILGQLLESFGEGWVVRVHKVEQQTEEEEQSGSHLPVFVFVMTKMMAVPGKPPVKVYEYVTDSGEGVRCDSVDGIFGFVKDCQQYALVRHSLTSLHLDEQFQMDLWSASSSNSSEPRYTLRVVDQPKKKVTNGLFAIFIAPQGRETNWLFSTDNGCRHLAENAGFERLVIVTLHRGHSYQGLDEVKEDVSLKAAELKQEGLPKGRKWPILSLGESVGARTVLCEDSSPLSGQFVVEELESDEGGGGGGDWVRRLVYLSAPHLAQTEVLMKPPAKCSRKAKSKQKQSKSAPEYLSKPTNLTVDHSSLLFDYHKVMAGSLALVQKTKREKEEVGGGGGEGMDLLIVGLGGGALPMFLATYLPQISQDVVELDPKMLEVACKWFGFQQTAANPPQVSNAQKSKINVHIANGISYILQAASCSTGPRYNAVVLDVDSKDLSNGMPSPPIEFTTPEFLSAAKAILKPGGVFVTNIVARNKALESDTIQSICKFFSVVLNVHIPNSVNSVLIGFPESRRDIVAPDDGTATPSEGGIQECFRTRQFCLSKGVKQKFRQFLVDVHSLDNLFEHICSVFSHCSIHTVDR